MTKPVTQEHLTAVPTHARAARGDDSISSTVSSHASPSDPAIDTEVFGRLVTLCSDDPDTLRTLIQDFLFNSQSLVDAVRQGVAAGDHRPVNHAAHALKASAGVFGALRLADLCRVIEERSADGLREVDDLLTRFDIEDEAMRAELSAMCQDPAGVRSHGS